MEGKPGEGVAGLGSQGNAQDPSEGGERERKDEVGGFEHQGVCGHDGETDHTPIEHVEPSRLKAPSERDR